MQLSRLFAVGILVLGVFILPQYVDAANPCTCVCSTSTGALTGQTSTSDQAGTVCTKNCSTLGGTYKTCAEDLTGLPENNAKCFTKEECTNRKVEGSNGEQSSLWQDKQPTDCVAGYHYCYNPPIPVNLSTAISTLENPNQASGIGEYIVAMYDLLLPLCALIAVVLLMVAGLQWVTAAGSQERISKAKDRITKAITGLVLVMGAYSIVYLVDPRLTSFDDLRVPVLKGAQFLDENTTCSKLEELKFEIEYLTPGTDPNNPTNSAKNACGATCKVTKLPQGVPIAGELKVGDVFYADNCGYSDSTCVLQSSGTASGSGQATKKGTCARCWDIYPNDTLQIPPSSSTCSRFDPIDDLRQKEAGVLYSERTYARCFASADSDIITALGSVTSGTTCALLYFSCGDPELRTCEDYGRVGFAVSGPAPSPQSGALATGFKSLLGLGGDEASLAELDSGDVTFQSVCLEDPCGLNCVWKPTLGPDEFADEQCASASTAPTNTFPQEFAP